MHVRYAEASFLDVFLSSGEKQSAILEEWRAPLSLV